VLIKEFKKIPEKTTIVLGFPGVGMAGAIAAEFIIHKLQLEEIGHVRSEKLPAVAIIRNSRPQAPIRIYGKDDFVFLVSDIMVPDDLCYEFARDLVKWLKEKKPKEVIILGGSEARGPDRKTYVISWKTRYLDETNLEHMKLGFVVGIYGPLMMELMENNIPGYLIMAEANIKPDPGAAAKIVRHLAERLKIDVDPSPLEKEAKEKKIKGPTWDPYPSIYG